MQAELVQPRAKPVLLIFFSPRHGLCRRVDAFLAQTLQRNRNHDTFDIRRIDVTRRPDLASRIDPARLPLLCVVEDGHVKARVAAPHSVADLVAALRPWLRGRPQPRTRASAV